MVEQQLVNGNAYDWVSITISLLGNEAVAGVASITYKDKQEKKDNYYSGKFPTSRGRGQVKYEASIELEEVEIRRILTRANVNGLKDVPPFTIVVSYLPEGAVVPVIDIITFAEFTGQSVETKAGDTGLAQKCELIIAGIKWGKVAA
jgi:hypothetical protein